MSDTCDEPVIGVVTFPKECLWSLTPRRLARRADSQAAPPAVAAVDRPAGCVRRRRARRAARWASGADQPAPGHVERLPARPAGEAGPGSGGCALSAAKPRCVSDYASANTITHDFDHHVVQQELLRSVLAVPLTVNGAVAGMLYAATRGHQGIGDVTLDRAVAFGVALEKEITTALAPPVSPRARRNRNQAAIAELIELAGTTSDPVLRAKLRRIAAELGGSGTTSECDPAVRAEENHVRLAPRELEALRHVAVGSTNLEVAEAMGLSAETARAYLRSAMRRLSAKNRTSAVHTARSLGLL